MIRALKSAFVLLLTVTAARAQTADAPVFSVGDTWKLSDGREITVVKVDENGSAQTGFLRECSPCVVHFDRRFGYSGVTEADGKPVDDSTRVQFLRVGPRWRFFDFPLQIGKSWSFSAEGFSRGLLQRYDVSITVESYEDVKTKAGTIKAFKLARSWRATGQRRAAASQRAEGGAAFPSIWSDTVWWAPEVKHAVKFTSMNPNAVDWDLVSYSLK